MMRTGEPRPRPDHSQRKMQQSIKQLLAQPRNSVSIMKHKRPISSHASLLVYSFISICADQSCQWSPMFTLSLWSYRGCHKSLPSISLSVNSALRQGIVEALYEHGLLVFRNQAHLIPQDEIAFAQLCPHQLDDKNVSYTGGFRIQYRLFPTIPQLSSWVLTLTKFVITIASHDFAS